MTYSDNDIAFLVNVQSDVEGLDWVLAHLRAHYPFARIEVCGDGDAGRAEVEAQRYGANYQTGPALFPLANGGAVLARTLTRLLAGSEQWLCKIDTDSGVYRRFAQLPKESGCHGSRQSVDTPAGPMVSIQGGCVLWTRSTATQILESNILRDPALIRAPELNWARSPQIYDARAARGLVSDDWLNGWALAALSLPCHDWSEVCCTWNRPVANRIGQFAITHPCKQRTLW